MDTKLLEYLQSYLTPRRKRLFNQIVKQRTRHFTVVTEDVYQLHNTSAVMRTCDVFGIQDLHIVEENLGKRIDKEIAMGAQKWVSLYRYASIDDSISHLKDKGYRIIATTPHHQAFTLQDFDVSRPAAFFFGKESEGLSDTVINQADGFLTIPMFGFTESLNISVSVAIILQTMVSRLHESGIDWQLAEEEQRKIILDWTKKSIKSVDKIIERFYDRQNN